MNFNLRFVIFLDDVLLIDVKIFFFSTFSFLFLTAVEIFFFVDNANLFCLIRSIRESQISSAVVVCLIWMTNNEREIVDKFLFARWKQNWNFETFRNVCYESEKLTYLNLKRDFSKFLVRQCVMKKSITFSDMIVYIFDVNINLFCDIEIFCCMISWKSWKHRINRNNQCWRLSGDLMI